MATEPVPTAVPVELTPEEALEEQALLAHPMLKDVLPLHETSDMVLVIRLRRYVWMCVYVCVCVWVSMYVCM